MRLERELKRGIRSVTVAMPVRNEERHVRKALRQVLEQQRAGIELEVLVVDGRSSDRTREIVLDVLERHPEVQLLDNPHGLSSAARNIAIRHSRGEYILLIDGHCEIPSRSYLRDLVDVFESSNADCLGRPQPLDVNDATTLQRAVAAARASWLGHHPDSFIYSDKELDVPAMSVAVAYRRSVFDEVGLFDGRFDACEDCELNHRIDKAGLRCVLVPQLTVKYQPRNSVYGLFRQLCRYGRGRVRLLKKHPDTFSLKSFLPALFLLGVAAGAMVCPWTPTLWWLYLGVIGAYLAAVLAVSVALAWRLRQPRLLFWLPIVFVTIHIGAASGSLLEIFHRCDPTNQTANLPLDWSI
jgi:succinoglycan biosynthesis protein ExoA